MPRYFIDFQDGATLFQDPEGVDLHGVHEARRAAIELLAHKVQGTLPDGPNSRFVAIVRDEREVDLYRATLTFDGERLAALPH